MLARVCCLTWLGRWLGAVTGEALLEQGQGLPAVGADLACEAGVVGGPIQQAPAHTRSLASTRADGQPHQKFVIAA